MSCRCSRGLHRGRRGLSRLYLAGDGRDTVRSSTRVSARITSQNITAHTEEIGTSTWRSTVTRRFSMAAVVAVEFLASRCRAQGVRRRRRSSSSSKKKMNRYTLRAGLGWLSGPCWWAPIHWPVPLFFSCLPFFYFSDSFPFSAFSFEFS
jgi:hypothetical protein